MREHLQHYINGAFVGSEGGKRHEVINPATEEACAAITLGSQADVDKAVAAAKAAFPAFAATPVAERKALLERILAEYKKRIPDFAAVIAEEAPGAVIMGKQAIDGDNNATGQMLSALLDWPQAVFASEVVLSAGSAKVTREIDGGLQTVEVALPAIITADLRLNEPRYASLPNIMKAKKTPLDVKELSALGVDTAPRLKVVKVAEPPKRSGGVKVESAADIVSNLKTNGVI